MSGGGPGAAAAAGTICLEKMTDEEFWAAAVLAVARAMLEASGILMVALTSLVLLPGGGGSTRFMVFRSRPRRSLSQGSRPLLCYTKLFLFSTSTFRLDLKKGKQPGRNKERFFPFEAYYMGENRAHSAAEGQKTPNDSL